MKMKVLAKTEPGRPRAWLVRGSSTHPGRALMAALGLHVGALAMLSLLPSKGSNRPPRDVARAASIEIALIPAAASFGSARDPGFDAAPRSRPSEQKPNEGRAWRSGARSASQSAVEGRAITGELLVSRAPGPGDVVGGPPGDGFEPRTGAGTLSPSGARARAIDLGLDGGIRDGALWAYRDQPPPAHSQAPSPGLLKEGLDALDAQRGVSRAGPAIHAGYEAARRGAPEHGIGIFDILTDDRGVVVSVSLVSSGADEPSWNEVGNSIAATLTGRKLRVLPDTKGLLTRIKIERGKYAVSLQERGKLSRVAAVGQASDPHPSGHSDSAHAQLEPGVVAPSAGVTFGAGAPHPTRVVVVFERAL